MWSNTIYVDTPVYLDDLHGTYPVSLNTWYRLGLTVVGNNVNASINGVEIFNVAVKSSVNANGWVGFGTLTYDYAMFDNVDVDFA